MSEGNGRSSPFDGDEPDDPDLDLEFPTGEGTADTEAVVTCPYCGVDVEVGLDPGSGAVQEYVEDCEVCCQPWRVTVVYDASGSAIVTVSALDE
jgi:hypothetical protein